MERHGPPARTGLYDPAYEHDSCGVGFVADIKGRKSRRIITDALQILRNLEHRGACGCDAYTGDGAGILIQLPHAFLARVADEARISLPGPEEYGTGLVFLPTNYRDLEYCTRAFERIVQEEGQRFLGWRDLPTDRSSIGEVARGAEPVMRQIFIGKGTVLGTDDLAFERKLYVIRKRVENTVRGSGVPQANYFYLPSLSSRSIVYKGLLLADRLARPDDGSATANMLRWEFERSHSSDDSHPNAAANQAIGPDFAAFLIEVAGSVTPNHDSSWSEVKAAWR